MADETQFKLSYLLGGAGPANLHDLEVANVQFDSRKIKTNDLFIAIKGFRVDGADYALKAQENGAIAVVSERAIEGLKIPNIIVNSANQTLSDIAVKLFPNQPKNIIAITGTNGKSSTVDFLRQIWVQNGKMAASLGTLGAIMPNGESVNLGFTTPDAILLHRNLENLSNQNITHVAMEASSHALEQKRMHGVKLVAGGFTNLTQDHLDYHETMDEYAKAKMVLFEKLLPNNAPAIINADAEFSMQFEECAKQNDLDLKLVGWRGNYLKIQELWPKPASQRVDYRFENKTYSVEIPLIGEFQALNATMAAGFALALGENPQSVFAAMANLQPVKGRMEHIGQTNNNAHVFVDYAHTPDGLDVLLRAIRPHAPGRIILVFGCGGDRDNTKRPLMGAIGAKHANITIVTDDNPRSENPNNIRRQIIEAVPNAIEIADRKSAINHALEIAQKGDAVIIAGKGHETGQIVGDVVLPFSDQETVIEYLNANGGNIAQ